VAHPFGGIVLAEGGGGAGQKGRGGDERFQNSLQ
jgi:hypothetical protein